MTEEQQTLLLIKGAISDLPEEQKVKVQRCAAELRKVIADGGQEGVMAFVLVGAEVQAQEG